MLATTDTIQNEPALNRRDAAEYLGRAVGTLDKWRSEGRGPDYIRLGGAVRYKLSALDAFISESRTAANIFGDDELLTDQQLARIVGKSVKTIKNQRGCGTGFPYIKLPGGGIRTRRSVVEKVLLDNSHG